MFMMVFMPTAVMLFMFVMLMPAVFMPAAVVFFMPVMLRGHPCEQP